MWQLSAEQCSALEALKRRRDLQRLGDALGGAFPTVHARVGARYGELIELGVQRGAAHGLRHALALARYLACWFVLGAEFEARDGHEWAAAILGDGQRTQGAKVFQLCRRTAEELARMASAGSAAPMPVADFNAAVVALDTALATAGDIGSLLTPARLVLGEPCDIDAFELKGLDEARPRYRLVEGQWQRTSAPSASAPVRASAAGGAAALPPLVHLIAGNAGQAPARLRLRVHAEHCCDPALHPYATLASARGLQEWRGEQTADATLALHAAAVEPPEGRTLLPALGAESAAWSGLLNVDACALRSSGAPMAPLSLQLQVHPAEQHLMLWQREPWPALSWPEAAATPPAPPRARLRLERDGAPLDGSAWVAGLEALDQQLLAALGRLATAWERESGVTQGRMHAEPRLMSGTAALSWGWIEGRRPLLDAPLWRLAAQLDLVACRLELRFGGLLALHGSRSRLQLHVGAAEELHVAADRDRADIDPATLLASLQCSFRQPFVLKLDAMAQDELALAEVMAPPLGGLVGACGLRPHPEGIGLQWFCTLELEPVATELVVRDPLLGLRQVHRPLLPALKLVDWTLG